MILILDGSWVLAGSGGLLNRSLWEELLAVPHLHAADRHRGGGDGVRGVCVHSCEINRSPPLPCPPQVRPLHRSRRLAFGS
jgi:hypothetical protein